MSTAFARIPVGVVVERRKATSQWIDFVWRPVAALPGLPDAAPWSPLSGGGDAMQFYAGGTEVELFLSEVPRYAENLASGAPSLWVVLRPADGDPPYKLLAVTANPSEGEAYTESGADLVEAVPMPDSLQAAIAAFVAEHPLEERFHKRERTRADPEAMARRDRAGREHEDPD
jgi:Protein of unknown function (DUF3305)